MRIPTSTETLEIFASTFNGRWWGKRDVSHVNCLALGIGIPHNPNSAKKMQPSNITDCFVYGTHVYRVWH
jgi:hypothetical protein